MPPSLSECVRYVQSDFVKIIVSNDTSSAEFLIHSQLLVSKSRYFAALKNFKEGPENAVKFTDMSPNAFGVVAYWFYHDDIPEVSKTATQHDLHLLMDAYAIADRLMIKACRISIMARILLCCRSYSLRPQDVSFLQTFELPIQRPLVQFCIDQLSYNLTSRPHIFSNGSSSSVSKWSQAEDTQLFLDGGELALAIMAKILGFLQDTSHNDPSAEVNQKKYRH